jgi:sec-independent protein translocase protein TatB
MAVGSTPEGDFAVRVHAGHDDSPLSIAAFASPHYDEPMSFSDTIFLFFLALVLFGPKKLPEMARQAGKLLAELRRASNEFKSQIETEIAHLEVQQSKAVVPSSPPPQGTVASLSANPLVGESIPHKPESTATLAVPGAEAAPPPGVDAGTNTIPASDVIAEASEPASQASNV